MSWTAFHHGPGISLPWGYKANLAPPPNYGPSHTQAGRKTCWVVGQFLQAKLVNMHAIGPQGDTLRAWVCASVGGRDMVFRDGRTIT
jgi:hypothetical protein